jgi:hypothetical protein
MLLRTSPDLPRALPGWASLVERQHGTTPVLERYGKRK